MLRPKVSQASLASVILCIASLHCAVDGFFEWRAIRGAGRKQPYAIAMKDGSPFGLAGLRQFLKTIVL